MLIADGECRHYTVIKNLPGLLRSSNTKHKCKQHFSVNCLQGFPTEFSRDKHFECCRDHETVRIEMPKEGSLIKFQDGQYQFKVLFIMYTDFEAILESIESPKPNPESPYTKCINQHIPSGFCVNSKFAYGEDENPLKLYRGKDCLKVFCDYISNEARRLYHMFLEKLMKPLTHEQWRKYHRAIKCQICSKGFKKGEIKVRDQCHYTGKYREPAHSICNLRYKISHYLPIVFHNLSRYDAHSFVRELVKKFDTD